MRILLGLHHYLDPNQGAPGVTLALGKALEAAGCQVEYFGFDHAFPKKDGGEVGQSLRYPWELSSFLSRHAAEFDIFDISTGDAWVWARRGRPGAKRSHALITRSHGLEHTVDANVRQEAKAGLEKLSWKYPLYHGGYRLWEVAESIRQADMALMLNQHDADIAVRQLGAAPERVHLIDNGIPDEFLGLPLPQDGNRQGVKIAQVGSYIGRKGIVYTSQALNDLLAQHKRMSITFLGTGCPAAQVYADYDPVVHEQVSVIPHYKRSDLPGLLQGHQVFLFPSLSEGFSLALPEAMACGLAPVATAIPGNTEIAVQDKNALLIPPRDSKAIKETLESLLFDPILLTRLQQSAYKTAQSYSWTRIAGDTLKLYEEALKARPAQ